MPVRCSYLEIDWVAMVIYDDDDDDSQHFFSAVYL